MTNEQLKAILDEHGLWLEGNGGCRANLKGVDLENADLMWANLAGANLAAANLTGANLTGARLENVSLTAANLENADLRWANLAGANLAAANLTGANLTGANLACAKGMLQWQSPLGGKRICYSVKHKDCVMHKFGCFWGGTEEAIDAIRGNYGENSVYEKLVFLMAHSLEQENE